MKLVEKDGAVRFEVYAKPRELVRGDASRAKLVAVSGLSAEEIETRLRAAFRA